MKIPQNKRTVHDILRYLKTNQVNGIIKKSMMDMANETGYSNATIHRSIKALEEEGLIQVIPSKNVRRPNTIVYIGPTDDEVQTLITEANIAVRNLKQATDEVQKLLSTIETTLSFVDDGLREYIELH